MGDRTANIDRILDISSFTTSRGFVVSSSDEEDNVKEVRRSSTAVGSRLNNLFGAIPTRNEQKTQSDSKKPLFADSVVLYASGDSGQLEPKGPVGVAVLERNQQMLLLIYNSAKQVISSFLLEPGSLSLSLQYGSNSYISISSITGSASLLFDESRRENFLKLTAIFMIFCEIERLDVHYGEGHGSTVGCHVLVEEKWFRLTDHELQVQDRPAQKFKLTGKTDSYLEESLGLGKGGSRVVRMAKNAVVQLTVKKIKQAGSTKAETVVSESETSSLAPPEPPQALEISDVEAEIQSIGEKTNDILSRIARVGQPIMPGFVVPKQTEEARLAEIEAEAEVPESPLVQAPGPSFPLTASRSTTTDYSTFHTVIGTEMDRLEIRLEAAVQRMVDRAVEPLQKDLKQLLLSQEKILERLDRIHSSQ